MPVKLMMHVVRKPGTTFNEFRAYYDGPHVALINELAKSCAVKPTAYKRYFPQDIVAAGKADAADAQTGLAVDAVCYIEFESSEDMGRYQAHMYGDGRLRKDEEAFLDIAKFAYAPVDEAGGLVI